MYKLPKKIKKSASGGMAGMTTTGGGEGVVITGQGSYPKMRKKRRK